MLTPGLLWDVSRFLVGKMLTWQLSTFQSADLNYWCRTSVQGPEGRCAGNSKILSCNQQLINPVLPPNAEPPFEAKNAKTVQKPKYLHAIYLSC